MGRARQGQVAVATDRFAALLGSTRGQVARDRLSAPKLSAAAKLELKGLLAAVKDLRLREPIAVIRREREHLHLPHLRRLQAALAEVLVSTAAAEMRRPAAALDLTGAHSRFAAQIVYSPRMHKNQYHLWPEGATLTTTQVRDHAIHSRTCCGCDLIDLNAISAVRGEWRRISARTPNRICRACADHADEFWETSETVRKPKLLDPERQGALHRWLQASAESLLVSGAYADERDLHTQMSAAYEQHIVEQAQAIYEQNPEWVLQRISNNGYRRLEALSGRTAPLSPYLSGENYATVVQAALDRDLSGPPEAGEDWVLGQLAGFIGRSPSK